MDWGGRRATTPRIDSSSPRRQRADRATALLAVALVVCAATVLLPVFGGHAWLLDWTPGERGLVLQRPFYGLDGGLVSGTPLNVATSALDRLIGELGEILPFVAVFPLVAMGTSSLLRGRRKFAFPAELLFALNPFVFDRLYVGQIGVLLGYALLPFAARAALRGPEQKGVHRFELAGWWAGAAVLSVHYLWIVGVIALATVIQRRISLKALAWLALSAATTGVLSSYLFFAQLGQSRPVAVTGVDLAAYRTQADPHLGLYGNVLGLYGFWRIGPRLPKQDLPIWPFLLAVILVVIATGAVAMLRNPERRPLAVVLLISGTLGFFLALGDQGPTGGLFRLMYDHLPLFNVMREPEKFNSLLALAYAVFFGFGVQAIIASVDQKRLRIVVAVVLVLLPIDYVPTIFDGLHGQIKAVHVPASFAQANALAGKGPGQVLALPWHQYLGFPWTGRVIANPLPTLFDRDVISGDDVELPGVPTTSTSQRSAYLEFLYAHGSQTHEFGSLIAPLGIQYVVLAKTVDFASYSWLGQQRDLQQVLDTPDLTLYRNTEPVDQGHRTGTPVVLRDWGQLVAVADSVDLAGAAVEVQHAEAGPVVAPATLPVTISPGPSVGRPSPVRATVPAGAAGLVTMAEPYDPAWRLDGQPPVELASGGMGFRIGNKAATVRFTHWHTTLVGYGISALLSLGLLIWGLETGRRRRRVR